MSVVKLLGNMVACEALREGLEVGRYFMFDAAVPSEAIDATLMAEARGDEAFAKYVPGDWQGYTNACWAANWHRLFEDDPDDARGRMGWRGRFADALTNATEVYNYYSSGDDVFKEFPAVPSRFDGLDVSVEMYCWQKQETLKGSAVLAGSAYGGWGFHNWTVRELVLDVGGLSHYEDRTYRYSPEDAVRMVADGSITNNSVFNRDFSPMFDCDASQDDRWLAVAKYVPAVSGAVGGRAVAAIDNNINMDMDDEENGVPRPNEWGRSSSGWRHSDMKDMAYFYARRGIFEYVLGGEKDARLLDVRVFDTKEAKAVYARQTAEAEKKGLSNCPLCAIGQAANSTRIYKFAEMDADHVTAWTKGGATDIGNCQMLCKTHNRAKGNR